MLARWLLLGGLLYLLGQYLEGTPYRSIVRNPLFVTVSFAIGLFAALGLKGTGTRRLVQLFVIALIIPFGFITFSQSYYDGSAGNTQYRYLLIAFGFLQVVNFVIFLSGIFKKTVNEGVGKSESEKPTEYAVRLFSLTAEDEIGGEIYKDSGSDPIPDFIALDGYSKTHYIELQPYWKSMSDGQLKHFETVITIYETIVKLGETHQLKDRYQLELELKK